MRMFLMVVAMVAMPVWANGQDAAAEPNRKLRLARGFFVAVIDADSREWQGRLVDVGKNAITVEIDALPRTFELVQVRRVDAHGDRVWDGVLKGAVFGGVIAGAFFGGRAIPGAVVGYGLVGLVIDAVNNGRHTVYRAPAVSASVKVLSW
jgi:hypothetical protein